MKQLTHAIRALVVAVLAVAALAPAACAAEFYLLGGVIDSSRPDDHAYSWQLEYRQDLFKHLAAGVSYLNEGHFNEHHRDGYAPQLWARTEILDSRLTLAAAAGPYFYLDTAGNSSPSGFSNEHGLKAMLSVAAAWHTPQDLIFELRSNFVTAGGSFDTTSVLAGIGYYFDPDLQQVAQGAEAEKKNEVTLLAGQTIVNSFSSEKSAAVAAEYRRRLWRYVEGTVSWLYEGDNRLVRRNGIVTQVWAVHDLREGMFSVAAGVGPYFNVSHYHHSLSDQEAVSAMLTLTASYRITPQWALRLSWNRLITTYDRDADVIVGGIGYRF